MKKQWKISAAVILLFAVMVSGTAAPAASASELEIEDGEYFDRVILEGGTGRASVTSPCVLTVEGENVYAQIEWSSPYYDYMIVDGVTFLPVNEEGNSVFEIPVTVFDEPITVIADTTAMSVPHEIEYTLTFDGNLFQHENTTRRRNVCVTLIVIAVFIYVLRTVRRHLHPPEKYRRAAPVTNRIRAIRERRENRKDDS